MVLRLRELTAAERVALDKLAHARTAPARRVERARISWYASQGQSAPAIAAQLRLDADTARGWIRRFNAEGLAGLEDRPRAGRPPTYSPEQVAEVVAAALTAPEALGLPFACWTLDRLAAYLDEHRRIPIRRSRIDEILRAEGLRWRRHESWFGERVDPEFAVKRGASRPSTRPHLRAA